MDRFEKQLAHYINQWAPQLPVNVAVPSIGRVNPFTIIKGPKGEDISDLEYNVRETPIGESKHSIFHLKYTYEESFYIHGVLYRITSPMSEEQSQIINLYTDVKIGDICTAVINAETMKNISQPYRLADKELIRHYTIGDIFIYKAKYKTNLVPMQFLLIPYKLTFDRVEEEVKDGSAGAD